MKRRNFLLPRSIWAAAISVLFVQSTVDITAAEAAEARLPIGTYGPEVLSTYRPAASQFRPPLAPLVDSLGVALDARANNDKVAEKSPLERVVAAGESLLDEQPRGYHAEILFLMGYAQELLGEKGKARQLYEKALKGNAKNSHLLFRHALLLKEAGKCLPALDEFNEVLWRAKESQSYEVLDLVSECNLQLDRKDEALRFAARAMKERSDYVPPIRRTILLQRELIELQDDSDQKSKLETQLIATLKILAALDPKDRENILLLAKTLIKTSDPITDRAQLQEAETFAKAAVEASNYTDAEAVRVYFDAEVRLRDTKKAEEILTKGLKKNPGAPILASAKRQLEIEKGISAKDLKEASK